MRLLFLLSSIFAVTQVCSSENANFYQMITASLVNEQVVFQSDQDFKEAMNVGFFRIKAPSSLNLEAGRAFAKTFTSNTRYTTFGMLDATNGYLHSDLVQTIRMSLERDFWDKCHIAQQETQGPPNYSLELQQLGHGMNKLGVTILRSILKMYDIPEQLWFKATAGSSEAEGSHFLVFHCYDPDLSSRPVGLGAHQDWGHITVLDATEPGLEAKIDGQWKTLSHEQGYLIINFGYPLQKLLPSINASEHRVILQTDKMRTSTVAFVDPRIGAFREGVQSEDEEGYVYDWDPVKKELINGETTQDFFLRKSNELYGDQY